MTVLFLIWCFITALAALAFIWTRIEPIALRLLAIYEAREKARAESARPAKPLEERKSPPADLIQFCLQESEDWARDQALKAMWEAYDDVPDWNRVRGILLSRQIQS